MIIDGIYKGEDLDIAKKIKKTRSKVIRASIQARYASTMISQLEGYVSEQNNILQKVLEHMNDIEAHFMNECISKKIKSEEDK